MKTRFICEVCKKPCRIEVETIGESPDTPDKCIYAANTGEPNWKPAEPVSNPELFGNSEQLPEDGKLRVRFKKLHPDAKAPFQGTPGSAGFDLTATSKERTTNGLLRYGTGLAVEIPEGHVGLVFPRSSIYKAGMRLTNSVGVIDSDYRGEITAVFGHVGENIYKVGDRIAQLVIMPVPAVEYVEAEELTETQRGAGGYGSTGR